MAYNSDLQPMGSQATSLTFHLSASMGSRHSEAFIFKAKVYNFRLRRHKLDRSALARADTSLWLRKKRNGTRPEPSCRSNLPPRQTTTRCFRHCTSGTLTLSHGNSRSRRQVLGEEANRRTRFGQKCAASVGVPGGGSPALSSSSWRGGNET